MKAGDKVDGYISGNRDDSVHENPDRLIIDRANARHHVAFGFGVHRMGNDSQRCSSHYLGRDYESLPLGRGR